MLLRKLAAIILAVIMSPSPQPVLPTTTFNGIVSDSTGTPVPTGNVTFTLKPGIDTTIAGNARFTPSTVPCVIANPQVTSTSGTTVITVTLGTPEPWQIGDLIIFVGTADSQLNASSVISPFTITFVNSTTSFQFVTTGTHTNGPGGSVGGIYSQTGTGPCQVVQNSAINPAYTSYSVAIQPNGSTTSSFNTYAIGAGPIDISTIVPTPSQQPSYSFVDLFSNGQTISGLKNFTNTANTYSGGTFTNPILNNATFNTTTATNWLIITPTIQAPTFTTQPITLSGTFNYSINWVNPAAARSLTIPDPGGTAQFVLDIAPQTLSSKTLTTPVLNGPTIGTKAVSNVGLPLVGDYALVGIVGQASLTFQSAAITNSLLFTYNQIINPSLVPVDYYLFTQQSGTGTTMTLTISWMGCGGGVPESFTTSTINLTVAGSFQSGTVMVCSTSGNPVNYSTTIGAIGTSTYGLILRARVE